MRLEGASPVGNLPHWGVHISFQVGVGVSVSSKCNKRSWVFSSPQQKLAQSAANCNSFLQMQAALLIQHTPGHNDGGLYQPGSHGPAAFQQRTHAQRFVASYYVHNMCTVYCIYIYVCVCVYSIYFQQTSSSPRDHIVFNLMLLMVRQQKSSPPHLRLCALVCNICCKISDGSERLRFIAEVGEEPLV